MNLLAEQFFKSGVNFEEVCILSEEPQATWADFAEKVPDLPRGWFELSRIEPADRVEFTRDFWLDRLPFLPRVHSTFLEFFGQLDDVAVVLRRHEDAMEAELVYSFKDNSCFFRGLAPANDRDLEEMKREIGLILPRDYLAFVRIHNGFGKLSEMGLLKVEELPDARRHAMDLLLRAESPVKSGDVPVDPGSLIPFYEAFGLSSFQCFYADWYPGGEMGNVYLSGIDYTISDTSDRKAGAENLAFPTFLEWLAHYLEGMSLSF